MTDNDISRLIRRLQLHSALGHHSAEAIRALPWRFVKRARQTYVLREGDQPKEVSVLLAGFAQRQKHTSEGTRQIVSFNLPGDPLDFDCLYLEEADASVQMCTNGIIACVRTDAINALLNKSTEIGRAVSTALLVDAAIFREWVVNIGRRDARQRIAHLLCELLVRLRAQQLDTDVFELPFTQEQLGDATGLTAIHVNRVLKLLATEGAIARVGRRVTVPDWERLQKIADFDDRFLHQQHSARS